MSGLKISGFSGISPRVSPAMLQESSAQQAENVKLYSGELRSWREASLHTTVSNTPSTIYKFPENNFWLSWESDVDVVPGPLADTAELPLYYTGDGYPKKTNLTLATNGASGAYPRDFLSLAVPTPSLTPSATVVGSGTVNAESRAYVYTYVSVFGDTEEESAPSPASAIVTKYDGDTVDISGYNTSGTYSQSGTTVTVTETSHGLTTGQVVYLRFTSGTAVSGWFTVTVASSSTYTVTRSVSATTSGNVVIEVKAASGKYNITKRRFYRTVTGSATTTYLYVGEQVFGGTTFSDSVTPANLGEQLPSLTYNEPPSDLKGLVAHPAGFLAGFVGKTVYFSEPFVLHAWPASYTLTIPYKIIGLAVVGQTIVAMTEANPYLLIGGDPASITPEKIPNFEPCVSKLSIATNESGVAYASPNGLIMVTPSGAANIVQAHITRDDWQAYSPTTMSGEFYSGMYFGFYGSGDTRSALIVDPKAVGSPISNLHTLASATFVDVINANLYFSSGSNIYLWEGEQYSNIPYEWKSKVFIFPRPLNFGALQVDADFNIDTATAEAAEYRQYVESYNAALFSSDLKGTLNSHLIGSRIVNGSELLELPPVVGDQYVNVTVYADGTEVLQKNITSPDPIRLPSGFKAREWEFRLSGTSYVRSLKVSESIGELKTI